MSPEINAIGGSVMEPYEETKTVSSSLKLLLPHIFQVTVS